MSNQTSSEASAFDDDLDIPDVTQQEDEVVLADVPADQFPYDVAFNMAFVGVGQAGARIAETFYKIGYRRVVVVDGVHQDLADVDPGIHRLDLQTSGSSKDIEYGAASVSDKEEQIWDLLIKGIGSKPDYIFVCASLGGGTGSGAAPTMVKICRNYMLKLGRPSRIGCIAALPMSAEGQRFARNTLTTFSRLRAMAPSPMILIDNQRIQDLFKVGVTKIYDKCNEQTAKLFHVFNQLAAQRSRFLTFDRAEFASLLDKGIVTFGASRVNSFQSAADVSSAIRNQLEHNVLAQVDLRTAREAGCIFSGSETVLDSVPMEFLDGGFNMLNRLLRDGAVVHRGVYKGSSDDLRCFTLLSGLAPPNQRLKELAEIAKIPASNVAQFLGIDDN